MADVKITGLPELTAVAADDYLEIVDTSTNTNKKIARETLAGWHFLTSPLTSTAWDGDGYSTTAKTLIDLSAVFGAPAGIKGIFVKLAARDSGSSSSAGHCQFGLSPNSTADSVATQCYLQGVPNDAFVVASGIVPCDANGDVYYQITASGSGTFEAYIEIWGYWL